MIIQGLYYRRGQPGFIRMKAADAAYLQTAPEIFRSPVLEAAFHFFTAMFISFQHLALINPSQQIFRLCVGL